MVGAITFAAALTALSVSAVWVTRYLQLRQAASLVPVELHVGELGHLGGPADKPAAAHSAAAVLMPCMDLHGPHSSWIDKGTCTSPSQACTPARTIEGVLVAERRPVRRRIRPLPVLQCDEAEEGKARDCPICLEEVTTNAGWTKFSCTHGTCSGAVSTRTRHREHGIHASRGYDAGPCHATVRGRNASTRLCMQHADATRCPCLCVDTNRHMTQAAMRGCARGHFRGQHARYAAPCLWKRCRQSQMRRRRQVPHLSRQRRQRRLTQRCVSPSAPSLRRVVRWLGGSI